MIPFRIFANNVAGVADPIDLHTLYRHFTVEVETAGAPVTFDVIVEGSITGAVFTPLIQTDETGIFSSITDHLIRFVRINLVTWDVSPSNAASLFVDLAAGE